MSTINSTSSDKKKFLFVYVSLETGGIETLILRISEWLIQNDHSVEILLLQKSGELIPKLNKSIKVSFLGDFWELKFISQYWFKAMSCDFDLIYSFSPKTTWISLLIKNKLKLGTQVLNGVYHPQDYKVFANWYERKIFNKYLPDRNKIFMTQGVKLEHEQMFKRKFEDATIWPLPIDLKKHQGLTRIPDKKKIVSIGRLTDFKTYNVLALQVIKTLLNEGNDVSYHIYGDGDQRELIQAEIDKLDLSRNVFLHGTLDYDKIFNVFSSAYLFIGMGTSAIEAAASKVPAIVAIAYSKEPVTHGLIHELPNLNCGELIHDFPLKQIEYEIKKVLTLSHEEYTKLCNESSITIYQQYDIEILMLDLFKKLESLKNNKTKDPEISPPYLYIIIKSLNTLFVVFKSKLKLILNIKNNNPLAHYLLPKKK
jgi:glycosyltransferase involved in cell wall biosynthesis